jgi:hypothetical protein
VDRYALSGGTGGQGEQPSVWTELALDWPSLGYWSFLEGAGLAESVCCCRVAKFMESDMALTAVGEGVVLFVMRTETASACGLEDTFRVLSGLLAFLSLHVLLEFTLVSDAVRVLWLNAAMLFQSI